MYIALVSDIFLMFFFFGAAGIFNNETTHLAWWYSSPTIVSVFFNIHVVGETFKETGQLALGFSGQNSPNDAIASLV